MGRTRQARCSIILAGLMLAVGCKNSVDVSTTDPPQRWRMVRYDCDPAGCAWLASDPDGAGRILLFTTQETVVSPAPSPDGRRLTYLLYPSARLVVRTLATQAEVDLEWPAQPTCVSWSPDGRLLAVMDFDAVKRTGAVHLVRPDGTGRRLLTEGLFNPLLISWSPDGSKLLITRITGELEIIDATTGAVERQIDTYGEWGIWSPDGQQIVYTRSQALTPVFYVINRDGTGQRQIVLTDPPDPNNRSSSFVWPTLSPDGRYIVATRTGTAPGGIFRVTLDGRRERWSNGEVFLTGGRHFWLPVD